MAKKAVKRPTVMLTSQEARDLKLQAAQIVTHRPRNDRGHMMGMTDTSPICISAFIEECQDVFEWLAK